MRGLRPFKFTNRPYAISPRVWLGPLPRIAEDDGKVMYQARIWRALNECRQ